MLKQKSKFINSHVDFHLSSLVDLGTLSELFGHMCQGYLELCVCLSANIALFNLPELCSTFWSWEVGILYFGSYSQSFLCLGSLDKQPS